MMNPNDPFSAGFWQSTTSQASAAAAAAGFFQSSGGHNNVPSSSSAPDAFAQHQPRLFAPATSFDQFDPNATYCGGHHLTAISAAASGSNNSESLGGTSTTQNLFATAGTNPRATPVINGSGMTASSGASTGFPHFTSFPTTAQYHPFVNFGLGAAAGHSMLSNTNGFPAAHSPASSLMMPAFASAAARAAQSTSASMLAQLKPSASIASLCARQSQLQQQSHTAVTPPVANNNGHLNLFDLSNNVVISSSAGAPTSVISSRNDPGAASVPAASSAARHDCTSRGSNPLSMDHSIVGEISAGLGFQFPSNRHNLDQNANTNLMAEQQHRKFHTSHLMQLQQQHLHQQLERSQSQNLLLKQGANNVGQGFLTGNSSKLSPVPSVVKIPTESISLGSPRDHSSSSTQQQQQQSSSQSSCQVCHLAASNGLHFGARTCAACAAFFRRSISDQKRYICKRSQRCVIRPGETQGYRKMCRNCRMKRCLEIGMLPENVQNKRHRREFYFVDTLGSIPDTHQSSSSSINTHGHVPATMAMATASSSSTLSPDLSHATTTVLRSPTLALTTAVTTAAAMTSQIVAAMAMNAAVMKSPPTIEQFGFGSNDNSRECGRNQLATSRLSWDSSGNDLSTIAGLTATGLTVKAETNCGGLKMDPFERLLANAVSSSATSSFLNPQTNSNNNTSVITSPSLATFGLGKIPPTLEPQLTIQQATTTTGVDSGLGGALGGFDPWSLLLS